MLDELQKAHDEASKFVAQALEPNKDVSAIDLETMKQAYDRYEKAEAKI